MILFMTERISKNGERAAALRHKLFGSQDKLSAAWEKRYGNAPHQTQISGFERGVKGLSLDRLSQLAELLETNTDYLLGLSDDDKPASDLEDQVVFPVRSEEERKLLDSIGREFLMLSSEDQEAVLRIVKNLPKKPRIIGGEDEDEE